MASEHSLCPCPECQGQELWATNVSSGGGHGPYLLPGLGKFLSFAEFRVVVCARCGLTRFFAEQSALQKLSTSGYWQKLT